MQKQKILLILFILLTVSIISCFLLIKSYQENKILRATFDNSKYYQQTTFSQDRQNKTIILFGDSRIKKWKPMLELDGVDIMNRGISEETTAQMMLRFKKDVLDIKPNIVIIQAGINDLVAASITGNNLKNRIYNSSIRNLRYIIDKSLEQGIIVIFLKIIEPFDLGLIRSILWGNDLMLLVQRANNDILELSNKPNFYILDANEVLHINNEWRQGVNRDTLHFTEKGYRLLNSEVLRLVVKI